MNGSSAIILRASDGSSVRIDRFPVVLGRSHPGSPLQPDCDLAALDPEGRISRQHTALDWANGTLLVTDLGSTNGTQLDGRPLAAHQPTPIGPRAHLTLGNVPLEVEVESAGPGAGQPLAQTMVVPPPGAETGYPPPPPPPPPVAPAAPPAPQVPYQPPTPPGAPPGGPPPPPYAPPPPLPQAPFPGDAPAPPSPPPFEPVAPPPYAPPPPLPPPPAEPPAPFPPAPPVVEPSASAAGPATPPLPAAPPPLPTAPPPLPGEPGQPPLHPVPQGAGPMPPAAEPGPPDPELDDEAGTTLVAEPEPAADSPPASEPGGPVVAPVAIAAIETPEPDAEPASASQAEARQLQLETFVRNVFAAYSDPGITNLIVERGRKVRLRRDGEWIEAGTREVTRDAWTSFWDAVCRMARIDPAATGYVSAMLSDGSVAEAVLPPLAVEPVFRAEKRAAPRSLDELAEAGDIDEKDLAALRGALADHRGVVVVGAARGDRTAVLESLIDALPGDERVAVVERRPAIRSTRAEAIRLRSSGDQGAAAVAAALPIAPDWLVIDEALPGALGAAALQRPAGGPAVIIAAQVRDAIAWRERAAEDAPGVEADLARTKSLVSAAAPVTVRLGVSGGRARVEAIEGA